MLFDQMFSAVDSSMPSRTVAQAFSARDRKMSRADATRRWLPATATYPFPPGAYDFRRLDGGGAPAPPQVAERDRKTRPKVPWPMATADCSKRLPEVDCAASLAIDICAVLQGPHGAFVSMD